MSRDGALARLTAALADMVSPNELPVAVRELLAADNATVDLTNALASLVRGADGTTDAVLLAVRADGLAWTDDERAALRIAGTALEEELPERDRPARPGRHARQAADLETRLRRAVADREFSLQYQPEVDMRSGKILAVEALLRWNHPERGQLSPDTFIELVERSDLITILGAWIIDTAIAEYAAWAAADVVLRINVSPAQLTGDGVVEDFSAALEKHGIEGQRICVEFTETADGDGTGDLARTLRALRELGITSAIDDLATGYSTLSRLRSLPVDYIKIDRSLVTGIAADARARAIVRALVVLADELNLQIVAEGIENAEDVGTLLGLGCHRGQGHYFHRAGDAATTLALLRSASTLP